MSKKLKVNPLFYRNFSKWLRKETMGFKDIDKVTRVVLNKIRSTQLTSKDVSILLYTNNQEIHSAVFQNSSVPFRIKYKFIIRNKLYNSRPCLRECIRQRDDIDNIKIKRYLLKHYEKQFFDIEYSKRPNADNFIKELYRNDDSPLTNITKYEAVRKFICCDYSSWDSFQFSRIINMMSDEDLESYIRLFFDIDVKNNSYYFIEHSLKMLFEYKNEQKECYKYVERVDLLRIIKEYVPLVNCGYSSKDLLEILYKLYTSEVINENYFEETINLIGVDTIEKRTVIDYLVALLKRRA
jgi:hypothetical protein